MSTPFHLRWALAVVAALAVVMLLSWAPTAQARGCGSIALSGLPGKYKVKVDRGDVSCKTAKKVIRRYAKTGATEPFVNRGWFCFAGRQGDRYVAGCQTRGKRDIVRAYRRS